MTELRLDRTPPTAADLHLMEGTPVPADRQVSLANWQKPPGNRWGFQHVSELLPTARVARGDGPVWELSAAPRDLSNVPVAVGERDPVPLGSVLDATYTDGFLVLHHGRVVLEEYANGMHADTRHLVMSVSKSFCGSLTGVLVGRGHLDPDALVADLMPELAETSFAGATVRDLLDMSTGTQFSEDYHDPESECWEFDRYVGWTREVGEPQTTGCSLEYILGLGNDRPHGREFDYRSVLTDLLAAILERVTATRYPELMSRELWSRLGAEHDAEIALDRAGWAVADGGLCVTLRDLARFGQLHLQGGTFDGSPIVPAAWVRDSRHGDAAARERFARSSNPVAQMLPGGMYRNQWWSLDPEAGVMLALGVHGQAVLVHPPADMVIVKLSSWPGPADDELVGPTFGLVAAVLDALAD